MKVLVVGANGQIGKHLVSFIQKSDDLQAKAMIRKEEQASYFKELGADTAIVDLEGEIDDIAEAAKDVMQLYSLQDLDRRPEKIRRLWLTWMVRLKPLKRRKKLG